MFRRLLFLAAWLILFGSSAANAQANLYFMERETGKSIPIPANTDVQVPETDEAGVYSGIVNITKGMTFGFYTGEAGNPEVIYQSVSNSNISFYGMENPVWPASGNGYAPGGMREKGASEIGTWWYISSFTDPQEKVVPVLVTVDLNTMHLTLAQQEIKEEMPECLYMWGSPDGDAHFKCVARLLPLKSNPDVFETVYDVPQVDVFIDDTGDGAGSGSVGDEEGPILPEKGFRFNISTDGSSVTGGKKFYASLTDFLIDFTDTSVPFESSLAVLQGCVFFDLTPGMTLFTIDYSAKKIRVEIVEDNEEPLYLELE